MSQTDSLRAVFARVSDAIGGFERLACPRCTLVIRFRGVSAKEAEGLRHQMDAHIARHTA
ncbi:hypothetical protein [Streptomyces sp. NPDC059176]|uniref:hypothetical protein n=1 Tax=Streptomyces sp. NPDC059176 TaxID=3346758 RepID=UPI0036B8394C